MKGQTNLNLEREYIDILQGYPLYLKKGTLSALINDFLQYMAFGEEELTPSQIQARVKVFAIERRRKLLEQTKIETQDPEKEEIKIRCWDKGLDEYRMVPKSEIERDPDWYIIKEETGRYEA